MILCQFSVKNLGICDEVTTYFEGTTIAMNHAIVGVTYLSDCSLRIFIRLCMVHMANSRLVLNLQEIGYDLFITDAASPGEKGESNGKSNPNGKKEDTSLIKSWSSDIDRNCAQACDKCALTLFVVFGS